MALEKELLNRLLAGRDPNEVFARDGLLDEGDTGNARSPQRQFEEVGSGRSRGTTRSSLCTRAAIRGVW
ncbi:MAG: hypothetical protein E5V16_00725 [Mesorhizobium sp.]|nr:MAG: hypothetical protein E5V16_00725 [Mesorhizobium sp.]